MINLRVANNSDLEFIAHVCRSNSVLYDPIMPGAFNKQAEKYLSGGLPKSYDMFICEEVDKKIGFLGTKSLTKSTTYLVALYIDFDIQRFGYGKKIMESLLADLKSNNVDKLILLVHKDAMWAKSFYERVGFAYISDEEDVIKNYDNGILKDLYLRNTELYSYKL